MLVLLKIDGDNLDGYLKALGLGFIGRIMAKTFKPRLVIVEQDGKWTLRTETGLKPTTIEFTENVEYDETTPGGHKLKVLLTDYIETFLLIILF